MSELIPVRFSHLLGFAGIGSIIRSERYLYTIKDTRTWPVTYPIPYLERVRCALELSQQLHEPPKGIDGDPQTLLPGMRFPSWMRCSNRNCELMHWRPWNQPHDPKTGPCCTACGHPLDQYPWVVIDNFGRMDDVPWHWLLHRGSNNCRHDWQKQTIKLHENNTGKRWTLECTVMGCRKRVDQDDNINQHAGLKVFRHQPWFNEKDAVPQVPEDIKLEVRIADISSPGLYAVPMCSALVIPPESRVERGSVIDLLYRNGPAMGVLKNARNDIRRKMEIAKLSREFQCNSSQIVDAWQKIDKVNGYPLYEERSFTPGQIHEDEFMAMLTPLPDQREDEDLVTFSRTCQWKNLSDRIGGERERACIDVIQELIEVKRLREIRVFKGFTRLGGPTPPVPPNIVGQETWLPAIELFGEGIFLVLSENVLGQWEQQPSVIKIAAELQERFETEGLADQVRTNGGMQQPPNGRITPRFILLHTLSHMLIRQFETSAGYPASSLKERIYCGTNMAGLLIYVAVPDVAGSLGGLSELAKPERFLAVLSETFRKAEWCSLDPVCSEHEGQGPHQLNRSACHGCALIPEPACVLGNEILDRTFVKGDHSKGIASPLEFAL
ncbi:DrmB family protein [Rhodoferax sp.]|uniref:DrmB family protein n=1 Tax=Rhodoferax sp. TaxID=50421 RepID=UPI0039B965D3